LIRAGETFTGKYKKNIRIRNYENSNQALAGDFSSNSIKKLHLQPTRQPTLISIKQKGANGQKQDIIHCCLSRSMTKSS
jgi:hypothetical protein